MSELASSDLSPSATTGPSIRHKSSQLPYQYRLDEQEEEREREIRHQDHVLRELDRNVTSLCSSLDISTVYRPPSSLQLPGETGKGKAFGSASGSGSESESSDSGGEEVPPSRHSSAEKEGTDTPDTPNVSSAREKPTRQSSFGSGSILGHIASQAKELVKETKRQSSQEGILSTVDKVMTSFDPLFLTSPNANSMFLSHSTLIKYSFTSSFYFIVSLSVSLLSLSICALTLQLKSKTRERLTEAKRQGSSSEDSAFLSPLEHVSLLSLPSSSVK